VIGCTFMISKIFLCLCLVVSALLVGCEDAKKENMKNDSVDINAVKETHEKELMSNPGVVGVYIGQSENGKSCIVVMVKKKTPELEKKIPAIIDNCPVCLEETGEIKPLTKDTSG